MGVIVVVINGVCLVSLDSIGFLFLPSRVVCRNVLYSCCDRVVVVVVSCLVFCIEEVVFPSLASVCSIGYVVNRLYHGHGHGWSFCEGRAVVVVSIFSWRWCIVVW